jgi:hypothetical protein
MSKISATAVADIFDGRRKLRNSSYWKARKYILTMDLLFTEHVIKQIITQLPSETIDRQSLHPNGIYNHDINIYFDLFLGASSIK